MDHNPDSQVEVMKIPRIGRNVPVMCYLHNTRFATHAEYRRHIKEQHTDVWMDQAYLNSSDIYADGRRWGY